MGSIESGLPLKKDLHLPRSASIRSNNTSYGHRNRSRFARFVFFKRLNYLQLICSLAVFFSFVFLLQMFFLPGSVMEEDEKKFRGSVEGNYTEFSFLKELDFGVDVKFESFKVMERFRKESHEVNASVGLRKVVRFGYRQPKLALVFADLWVSPLQILMATVSSALRLGYEIEVFSLEDGPVHSVWKKVGVRTSVISADENMKFSVDWLNYDGILVNSLEAVHVISCLMQAPFKSVPLVWTIHEQELAARLRQYVADGQTDIVENWRKVFSRPSVIVFPDYNLPMAYSLIDPGNYFVIPGSPEEALIAEKLMVQPKDDLRLKVDGSDDFIVAIVGSQLQYRGLWLEHALVIQALHPLLAEFRDSSTHLKILVFSGDSASNYSKIVQIIELNLKFPNDTVKHVSLGDDTENILSTADLVVYGSFLEELSFPDILLKSMCLGKTVIAPDLPMIQKYISDRVNGYLFPKEDIKVLTQIMFQMVSNRKLSLLARNSASIGQRTAKNLMVLETVEGYASLLENILMLSSEVKAPLSAKEIPLNMKNEWEWNLFSDISDNHSSIKIRRNFLDGIEKQFNHSGRGAFMSSASNDSFSYAVWEEQKIVDLAYMKKRREDDELKDRTDQPRGSWDEVYRNARRVDRSLHERDDGEIERTGQPLCIYEPYYGEGTWPFLHNISLYRGLGLTSKGRRPGGDDVDLPSRLPILNNAYYRDVLGEYGAFFAIANRIDRIHKNAWIGFQSWRATARMKSLSKAAERSLLDDIEARRHGDTLYFWARMDVDPRNQFKQDFWSFCDAINAGNCQYSFSETLEKMYGINQKLTSLPPMPADEGTWSVMHSWVLPTKSFMEFVMFSRMFVDALDAQFHDGHLKTGRCYLSLSKDKHCYSRMLELLVNVWAYHSGRRMVYVDPETGSMEEQHMLKSRRGRMWIKWFQLSTLKSMDEDLAEEFDSEHPDKKRWLWPATGEIFWQGILEKERNMRNKEKEKKRQQSKEKIQRIRNRTHQKVIGKYVKPLVEKSNSTSVAARLLR